VLQAVATHGSVAAAADALHLTPPAVSQRLPALEREIIPALALGQAPVTVRALPWLGGRHIAAWHPAGKAHPAPAAASGLDVLAGAGQESRHTS
jgi:Ser/Thr protein kinase RdoA (MazF antagonist)